MYRKLLLLFLQSIIIGQSDLNYVKLLKIFDCVFTFALTHCTTCTIIHNHTQRNAHTATLSLQICKDVQFWSSKLGTHDKNYVHIIIQYKG